MNMKLSNNIKSLLKYDDFDLEHESKMVQARILSTFLEIIDQEKHTQLDLEKLTGLKQPFLSGLFNQRRKLNMDHIALLQKALKVKLEPPKYLEEEDHIKKFYSNDEYEPAKSYFSDSFSLKNKPIIRWVNAEKKLNEIDKKDYTLLDSDNLPKLKEEKIEYLKNDADY